ncbi:MAG: hypothetical protein CL433_09730 [Acidimicrobiaceae bacterium]|nr:hypothetical protein [Acidimicrobiaceae bacterium]HAB57495.1 hypothetical protein [Acidimicrobiaceae bacterium]
MLMTSSSSVTTITAEGPATVAVDRVPVADTVGAGDAFCGGVLTQLWERGIHTPGALATVALAEWRDIVAFAIRMRRHGPARRRRPSSPRRALTIPGDAEAEVARRCIRRVRTPGTHPVAIAIRVVAEITAAAHRTGFSPVVPPVRGPLPDVSGEVEKPEPIRLVAPDR